MSRFSLLSTVAAVCLLVVSFGVARSQSVPLPAPKPRAVVPQPAALPAVPFPFPQGVVPAGQQGPAIPFPQGVVPGGQHNPYANPTIVPPAPAEKMTVKVYSVPDLVAAVESDVMPRSQSLAANPELAQVIQQVQLQVQAAIPVDPSEELTKKLERLKKALLVAAPKKSWEENGGEGEIEVYPEAHCLIVRQTASGHEAIADLLSQLRATQDVQIELAIEILSLEGISDELTGEAMKFLNRDLSPEELAQFRKCGAKTGMSSTLRMTNGRSAAAGLVPEMPLQFTAVASANRRTVEFRSDLRCPVDSDSAGMFQACSQSRTVAVGKSVAFLLGAGDPTIMLVTPNVIVRAPGP